MTFENKLATLLRDRKHLRELLAIVTTYTFRNEPADIRKAEMAIAEFVLAPLPSRNPRTDIPPSVLAEACSTLLHTYRNDLTLSPLAWDRLISGYGSAAFPVALRERLTALAGPLDVTLERMLEAA